MSDLLEIWKNVVGFEGMYEVSNFGNVRSVCHVRETGITVKGVQIKTTSNGAGYKVASLRDMTGKKYTKFVHHLVMYAFAGPRPGNMDCCHKDGNGLNNKFDNLRYDTRKRNLADRVSHGTATSLSRNDPRRPLHV